MNALTIGHRRGEAAERTLAMAAAVALAGYRGDGGLLAKVPGPSMAMVAGLAGLRRESTASNLAALQAVGELRLDRHGPGRAAQVVVDQGAIARRWADARQRCRIAGEMLQLGLRPRVAVASGLVLGQLGTDAEVRTVPDASARLQWPLRSVERALGDAVAEGILARIGPRAGWRAGPALTTAPHATPAPAPTCPDSAGSTCPDSAGSVPNLSGFGGLPLKTFDASLSKPPAEALLVAVARVLGDRQAEDVVARELGVPLDVLVAAVEAERARRHELRQPPGPTPPSRIGLRIGVA
ncbi:MAG: hypothetical protein ACK5BN_03925 [Planctomycetota bacterium]